MSGGSGYTPFCPAGLGSYNQTYKSVIILISEYNIGYFLNMPRYSDDILKEGVWGVGLASNWVLLDWIVCIFADDV